MKYISFFSGIGGFEVAIHKLYPDAECIGYSEIKPSAIKVYEHHYPQHKNLGDITKITEEKIREITKNGCDLIVAGFPCTNLSSLSYIAGNGNGLKGPKSGLFFYLIKILQIAKPKYIVIENNYSMTKQNTNIISEKLETILQPIFATMLDSSRFGVQTRKRIYWTNFPLHKQIKETQVWKNVLEPLSKIKPYIVSNIMIKFLNKIYPYKKYKVKKPFYQLVEVRKQLWKYQYEKESIYTNRLNIGVLSDTMKTQLTSPYPVGKSRTITASTGNNNLIFDRRPENKHLIVRQITPIEKERLFNFPDNWTSILGYKTPRGNVLGNTVVINVILYILTHIT
jgi:DNA-cytosine methyltransferase